MRNFLKGVTALLGVAGLSQGAEAQTLRMMKSLDAPHYDGQRTTWSPTSDIVNMFQDTLVAMDWDGKTAIPYLAKSWTVSPDGKLYTFKLRDDVSFCSGKKFTAEDVDLQLQAAEEPRTQGAACLARRQHQGAARARSLHGRIRAERALLRPAAAAHHVHQRRSTTRRAWRRSARTTASRRSTAPGPWCFESWQPRTEIVLKRHDAYKWGPSMYAEQGAGEVREAQHQDRARGFQPRRRHDGRPVRRHPPDPAAVHPAGQGRRPTSTSRRRSPTSS